MALSSSAVVKNSKDVEFEDVVYVVKERKHFVKVVGERQILTGVSGCFRSGQLSAIMGPSGAGKSSLLNALSGYITSGVSGHIRIDRKHSCYITQEDHHQTLLSVEELMNLACDLKLKRDLLNTKEHLIKDILEKLNLYHRRNVNANNLSGGERKRLSVALEMVANPKIFFLDEPTSGLDEVTAAQCIRLLKFLAKQGHTIVCTIHQPSATVFNYFDNVYVLAKGRCVYQGSPKALVPYLRFANKECPKHYSPPDYIIELCDFEDPQMVPTLCNLVGNGKLVFTALCDMENLNQNQNHEIMNKKCDQEYKPFRHAVTSFFPENPKSNGLKTMFNKTKAEGNSILCSSVTVLLHQIKQFSNHFSTKSDEISPFRQFSVLFHVLFLRILRARIPIVTQLIHHVMVGLFFGMLYFKMGNEGAAMFGHLKFCISVVVMIAYTQVLLPVLQYPYEVKIVKKQTFNHWYTLPTYYMALCLSRLPLQIFYNILFLTLSYWLTGYPAQWWRFCLFVGFGLMVSFVAEGVGLTIGAAFGITNGSVVGPMTIAAFMGLAIYGFDFAPQIPVAMDWLMKVSFMRDGVVGLVITLFGFGREVLDCSDVYCHFGDPRVLLRFLDLEKITVVHEFAYLFVLLIVSRIALYLSLRRRCRT